MVVVYVCELQEFQQEYNSLKAVYDQETFSHKHSKQGLINVYKKLTFQNDEKVHEQQFDEP